MVVLGFGIWSVLRDQPRRDEMAQLRVHELAVPGSRQPESLPRRTQWTVSAQSHHYSNRLQGASFSTVAFGSSKSSSTLRILSTRYHILSRTLVYSILHLYPHQLLHAPHLHDLSILPLQSEMWSLMTFAAASTVKFLPIASTKSPSGSVATNSQQNIHLSK
jgi:hypothetical protein